MARVNRRRLITGAMAGAAGLVAAELTGWPGTQSLSATAQTAFDLSAGSPGCSQVALMFNIGAGYEPALGVLDTLGTYGAPATMFVMGWLAEQSPWLVQQIAAWGHPVGSHGYVPPELTIRSDDDVAWDLQAASDALTWALGYRPGPWFTPYASASDERVRSIGIRARPPSRSTATSSIAHTMAQLSSCISMPSEVSMGQPSPCRGSSRT
jgi:peptidoglycan/xylan/chitin deacetylase (PgdA/CDA1 family)